MEKENGVVEGLTEKKVDTERFPQLAGQYNVRSIPNFAVFPGGQLQFQHAGLVDAATMESWRTRAAA